jgi:hypothetical protein
LPKQIERLDDLRVRVSASVLGPVLHADDVVLTLGAGSIGTVAQTLPQALAAAGAAAGGQP